ncbi:MAG: SDR family NAD(P)-dependent oxidoreductase [Solirubrobacterales bacterium]
MTFTAINDTLLVTGATSGIGQAVAGAALDAGLKVAIVGRRQEALDETLAELGEGREDRIAPLICDVSDEDQVAAAVAEATERLGPPLGLVTSAAVDRGGLLHELDPESFDAVIATNLRGTYLLCRACLPGMIAAGSGSIVCVSSPLGLVATAGGSGAYSASKAGINAIARSIALDYADHGIRANALLPGPTETKLMWANVPDAEVAEMRATINHEVPLGRLAQPEEIAHPALWLLSDEGSYITGGAIPCDGGVLAKASVTV